MNRLYIEDTEGNVQVVPIESDEMSIGRAGDNDLVLTGRNVSRHHASISRDGRDFVVGDAGARYGLKVNGLKVVDSRVIEPGDVIELGDYKLKVLARDRAAVVSPDAPTVDEPPERRQTVPDRAAVSGEPALSEAPTRVNVIQEMEDLASSSDDWDAELTSDEQAVLGHGRTKGRGLILAGLLILAASLGLVYYWVSGDTATSPPPKPVQPVAAVEEPEKPVKPEAPPAPEPAPVAKEQAPAEAAPVVEEEPLASQPKRVEKAPPRKAEKPAAKKAPAKVAVKKPVPRPKKRVTVKTPKKEPAPKKKPRKNTSAYDEIDRAINGFDAAQAESLLRGCKGSGCFKRWKKVAKMYEGLGDPAKAIRVYRKLIGMTRDPTSKERFRKRIIALGGTPE